MFSIEKKHLDAIFSAWADIMLKNREYLIKLDGVAGDSDLGLTMTDGFAAAKKAVLASEETDIGKLFYTGGKAIMSNAPSSLGTLLGSGFLEAGKRLKGKDILPLDESYVFFQALEDNIMMRGGSKIGEKTFLDGIDPAIKVLVSADWSVGEVSVLKNAASAAEYGAEDTRNMVAKHGRMAIRGEDSIGMLDPGAVVGSLLVVAFTQALLTWLN